jgi:hypothetical protein
MTAPNAPCIKEKLGSEKLGSNRDSHKPRFLKDVDVENAEFMPKHSATDTDSEPAVCEKGDADDNGSDSVHQIFSLRDTST